MRGSLQIRTGINDAGYNSAFPQSQAYGGITREICGRKNPKIMLTHFRSFS
jgi:hypothetical protein